MARLSSRRAQDQLAVDDLYLIALAKQGDPTAYDRIVRRYYGFVRLKASSYFLVGGDSDDLIQEGLVGLYKAVRDYRDDRQASFRSFAELLLDMRDRDRLLRAMHGVNIVVHAAALKQVPACEYNPMEAVKTNILGTANVLEACRRCESVKAVVVATTDKCYENKESRHAYKEDDRLGGHDPYSASKACAELLAASYRDSFFRDSQVRLATARAGNVIGGGDFSEDRLIPDAVRAFSRNQPLVLRKPQATRPWQHVLEPLSGYIALAEKLLAEPRGGFDCAWNFGPNEDGNATVAELAERFAAHWEGARIEHLDLNDGPHEAGLLMLDNSKAREKLGWAPRWSLDEAVHHTAAWYKQWLTAGSALDLMMQQIQAYFGKA